MLFRSDPITREHDLMLIRLRRPASLGPAVRPLALGTRCPTAGTRCHISGWGSTTSPKSMTPKREIWGPKWRWVGLGVNGMTRKWEIWPQNGRFGPKMEVCGVGCQWDDPKVGDLAPKWRSLGLSINEMTPKWEIWPQNGGLWG